MASEQDINSHNELILEISKQFAQGLAPLFTELFDNLAGVESPTRAQVLQLFQPIRTYTETYLSNLDTVIQDNLKLNSDQLDAQLDPETASTVQRLTTEVSAALQTQVEEEQNTITNAAVLGGITAGLSTAVLGELRATAEKAIRRLELTMENNIRKFDGALTLVRAKNSQREVRYRYVGGVIAESRDFCRQMDGRVLTESEIRSIWSSQEWSGKQPGDPFVVRGGYNCRHSWVPVVGEE